MTDDHAPLEPDQLDELLSAELDGELDAAARDFGLTPDEVGVRLRATPGVDERRRALTAARDQLFALPPLDELLEARLRAKAVRVADDRISSRATARRERRRHVFQGVGAIAAAAVLVLAVGGALRHNSTSSTKASTAAPVLGPSEGQSTRAAGATNDLGAFTDAHALDVAAVARSAREQDATGTVTGGAVPQASTPSPTEKRLSTTTVPARSTSADNPSTAPDAAAATKNAARNNAAGFDLAQADAVARAVVRCGPPPNVSVTGKLSLRASAVLAGSRVVVLVFSGKGGNTVVIENPDCTLKSIQEMG
jgi:hypothetical protein